MKRLGNDYRFNLIGGGIALSSIVLPWYVAEFCGPVVYWIYGLPQITWLVLPVVAIGAVFSLFSRYGGIITIAGSLLFIQIFQLPFYITTVPSLYVAQPCPGGIHGLSQPTYFDSFGFWFALAGGALSLLGISWNLPWNLRRSTESDGRQKPEGWPTKSSPHTAPIGTAQESEPNVNEFSDRPSHLLISSG